MTLSTKTMTFTVFVPVNVTEDETAQYVTDALGSWGGSLHPDDPRFFGVLLKTGRGSTHRYIAEIGGTPPCVSTLKKIKLDPKPRPRQRILGMGK